MSGARNEALGKLSAAASKRLRLPDGIQFFSAWPFGGLNQTDARTALDDNKAFWLENYIYLGKGRLRTLWDRGTALYSAPTGKKIVWFQFYNIGRTHYVAVFHDDGTAVQVQQSNAAITTISAVPNTFYNSTTQQLPFACQSGAQYLLISNNNTQNDYWIWDGTVLYSAGSIAPTDLSTITSGGSGYTSIPSYLVYGGSGSGVVLTPVLSEGSVVRLIVNNPGTGYVPGDIVQVAFSGGGTDSTPILGTAISPSPVQQITLLSGGTGYSTGTFPLSFTGGGGGTGAAGTYTASGGTVTSINLTNGGTGYIITPTVVFTGPGTGATAVASIGAGSVTAVNVTNGGSGLIGTPLLTIVGGGGTGATAVANVSGGSIVSATVTNAGSGYTSAPAVEVSGGLNNAASAVLNLMPFGVSGTSIETFLSRIWISSPKSASDPQAQASFLMSAPGSLTDFATSDGGLIFDNNSRFQRETYVAMHQSNGYLYPISDSSVDVISNVQTQGTPTTSTFNYQNTSAQIGAAWRDTVQDFGQAVLFANQNGIQGLYGGSVRRVSGEINEIFVNAFPRNEAGVVAPLPGGVLPSGAVMNIFTIPVYFLLMTVIDPNTQQKRNVMVGWDEKNWIIGSQTTDLTFIATQEQNSTMTAWGTEGVTLFPLFSSPSASLTKTLVTKFFGGEREMIERNVRTAYYRATDKSVGQTGVAMTTMLDGTGFNTQKNAYPIPSVSYTAQNPVNPDFMAPVGTAPSWGGQAANVFGTAIGATITSTSPDFELLGFSLSYEEVSVEFG